MKKLRIILAMLLLLLCLWFLAPACIGIRHIGMVYPVAILIPVILCLLKPQMLKKGKKGLWIFLGLCYLCGAIAFGTTVVIMEKAAMNRTETATTVIVPGCKVNGEKPGHILYDRCKAACAYMERHPKAVCVASGGKGNNEGISEAEAIYRTLTEMGIDGKRIYKEEHSTNTKENFLYSAAIIKGEGLSNDVAIATDRFHQLRTGVYAARAGLTPYSIPTFTYLFLVPGYWTREVLAIWALAFS